MYEQLIFDVTVSAFQEYKKDRIITFMCVKLPNVFKDVKNSVISFLPVHNKNTFQTLTISNVFTMLNLQSYPLLKREIRTLLDILKALEREKRTYLLALIFLF